MFAYMHANLLSRAQLSATPLTVTHQALLIRGVAQVRILEWVATFSSRGSSQPWDQTQDSCIPCIDRQILYHWATWETLAYV